VVARDGVGAGHGEEKSQAHDGDRALVAEEFGELCSAVLADGKLQRDAKLVRHDRENLEEEFAALDRYFRSPNPQALLIFVAFGALVVPAYNLEWFGGALHNTLGLALAWAAFPVLTAYFAEANTLRPEAFLGAGYAAATIVVQRTLSTPVRHARRTLGTTAGVEPMERALRILPWANVLLACALVVARLT